MLLAQCHAGDVIARAGMARLFDESCDVASSNQASEPAKCLFKTTRESVLAVLATLLEVHNNGVILCVDDLLPAVSSWQSGGIWCPEWHILVIAKPATSLPTKLMLHDNRFDSSAMVGDAIGYQPRLAASGCENRPRWISWQECSA